MPVNASKMIETWFAECGDDQGDFVRASPATPFTVITPPSADAKIVFATRPAPVAAAIETCESASAIGLVGRYGLPTDPDVQWIRGFVGPRKLLFLGDLDPPDLMIFCWLRCNLNPTRIAHLGLNDAFLAEIGLSLPESFYIECPTSELRSLSVLAAAFPDLEETVGRHCAATLREGRKMEVEAVVSATGDVTSMLRPVLTGVI